MVHQNQWTLIALLRSPGLIYGLVLLAFLGFEAYLILSFSADMSSKLVLMANVPRTDMMDGKQVMVHPSSGRPDHTQSYSFEKKVLPPCFDREAHFNYVFKLIEEGKF